MKTLVLACTLALLAVAGFAQPPGAPHITLADIMAPAAAPAAAVADQNQPVLASNRGRISGEKSQCLANCGTYNVICNYTAPSTCTAVDRNCPSTKGYVTCNGVTTYCTPVCPGTPICTPGTTRLLWSGYCCDQGGKARYQQVCSSDGTAWNDTGVISCGGICGPQEPIYP
jgi:hypothetical protein